MHSNWCKDCIYPFAYCIGCTLIMFQQQQQQQHTYYVSLLLIAVSFYCQQYYRFACQPHFYFKQLNCDLWKSNLASPWLHIKFHNRVISSEKCILHMKVIIVLQLWNLLFLGRDGKMSRLILRWKASSEVTDWILFLSWIFRLPSLASNIKYNGPVCTWDAGLTILQWKYHFRFYPKCNISYYFSILLKCYYPSGIRN